MNELAIRQIIEQIDPEGKIPNLVVDELAFSLNEKKDELGDDSLYVLEESLKKQLAEEIDWRKKATYAAKLISLSLE